MTHLISPPFLFHSTHLSFSSREISRSTHGLIWSMALSIHWSCKWARMLAHSSQRSAKWLGIWPWGRKMVISRLSRKISRMIKGDRQESLFLMWFYWLAVDRDKRANWCTWCCIGLPQPWNANILNSHYSLISHMFAHFQRSYVHQKKIEESSRDPGWLCVLKYNKRHRTFPVGTALTENKPSLTALQHPGISPGQEVLFLILSDLCMPFTADEGLLPCRSTLHGLAQGLALKELEL